MGVPRDSTGVVVASLGTGRAAPSLLRLFVEWRERMSVRLDVQK